VFLMEAFAFRCHPQTERLLELVRAGDIGEPRVLQAVFGYNAGPNPGNYLFRHDLAGGSILDVGCYTMSMARLVAGAASERGYAEPRLITGVAHVCDEHRVDHHALASLEFDGGLLAQLSCAVDADIGSGLRVVGAEGEVVLSDPWLPGRREPPSMTLRTGAATRVWGPDPMDPELYAAEADEVARRIGGDLESPAAPTDDSLGNMEALDRWRRAVGLMFPQDLTGPDVEA
jgi:predicted dehydrogenase